MNQLNVSGRMAATPELRTTNTGKAVTVFSLAVYNGKDRDPIWLPVAAFGKVAEFICQYFQKGDPIELAGKLKENNYTKPDGTVVKSLEVEARDVSFPPSSRRQDGTGATNAAQGSSYTAPMQSAPTTQKYYPVTEGTPTDQYKGFADASDDELPF